MTRAMILRFVFVLFLLSAPLASVSSADPAGRWVGSWSSHTTGHTGPLRARIRSHRPQYISCTFCRSICKGRSIHLPGQIDARSRHLQSLPIISTPSAVGPVSHDSNGIRSPVLRYISRTQGFWRVPNVALIDSRISHGFDCQLQCACDRLTDKARRAKHDMPAGTNLPNSLNPRGLIDRHAACAEPFKFSGFRRFQFPSDFRDQLGNVLRG